MGNFNIQRARGTLPGRATQVRADLDVRTGGQQIAQAVAGLGGAMANLGLRWDLIEADTQFNEAKMRARQEHIRLMLALPGLEPEKHAEEYEKSLKVQQDYMPKNKRAANSYGKFLNDFSPRWGLDVEIATKVKLKDNFRAVGFELQQEAIESGNFKEYFKHLEIGKKKLFATYDAEDVVKYKQNTIDNHKAYIKMTQAEIKRQQAEALKLAQEQTAGKLLVDIWDDKLDDPQVITDALRNNFITDTDAKYLRSELLKTEAVELDLGKFAIVKKAITDIGTGAKTRSETMSVLITNLDGIDKVTGKSLVAEIFGKHDKVESEMKREGRGIMEELIRDRDKFSGMFTDDERQILGTAEAILMFDTEIEKAAKAGKPLERRDQLIKAVQIGRQIKAKIKQEEADAIPPGFSPETEGYPTVPRAPDYTVKGKPIVKGALAKPDFVLTSEGEPEKVFDSEGREIGLRRKSGAVFGIGYHAIFDGKKYEYTGNGNWKLVR